MLSGQFGAALQLLARCEVAVTVDSAEELTVRAGFWGGSRRVRVKVRASPPTPTLMRTELEQVHRIGAGALSGLLYVVPRMSSSLRTTAEADIGVDVVATGERIAIIGGRRLSEPVEEAEAPRLRPAIRRRPWVRLAVMRALLRTSTPRTQAELALECAATQAAVSQALHALGAAVRHDRAGWVAGDAVSLWDRFLAEYPGPGGLETCWYGIEAPIAQAAEARAVAGAAGVDVWLSGDPAADWWAPWRQPATAVLYAARGVDLSVGPFADSDAASASLRLVIPADPTIWASARAWQGQAPQAGLLDPLLVAWDVQRSSGPDRMAAVGMLRNRVLGGFA